MKFAALFPGQGSQHVGMGDFLLKNFNETKILFEQASDTLRLDMIKLCLEGPEDKLQLTENTQPALVTVSYITFKTITQNFDVPVTVAAGHSVGEYGALAAAGVIDFAKAVELVRLRGQRMQQAVPVGQGGMAAVMGLSSKEVERLCQWAVEASGLSPLEPANFNAPTQTVISGNEQAIEWVQKNFTPEKINASGKAKLIPLKVSAPFHCSMMAPAEKEMAAAIDPVTFLYPQFPISQNFSGRLEDDPATLKKNLIAQITGPVRWVSCMHALNKDGVTALCEFGPGKVLTGLMKKIEEKPVPSFNFNSLDDIKNFEKFLGENHE